MASGKKISGKSTSSTSAGQRVVGELARVSGAGVSSRPTPGVMCQQGQDWSRGTECIPQKFVRLVGHRDPEKQRSSPLGMRVLTSRKKQAPSDTPIG